MTFVAYGAPRENAVRWAKGRRPTKFTPENIAKIKDWVAQGIGRDEIAKRLDVTVGSLQVTCSRLGISLRKSSLAKRNGTIQPLGVVQGSIGQVRQGDSHATAKFSLLIRNQNKQTVVDLPLGEHLIARLALEASVGDQTIADLIGKILSRVIESDLAPQILRDGNTPSSD